MREYANNFEDFKKRRASKYIDGKQDLGVVYLQELIYLCYEENLIIRDLMLSIRFCSNWNNMEFIKKYRQDKLEDFNFQACKFTILDHRRLADMLLKKDP